MALGSALGTWALAHWGWMGVIAVAGTSALAAFAVHGLPGPQVLTSVSQDP